MSRAFSAALDNVLRALEPGRRPAGEDCFPRACRGADLRVAAGEEPAAWFRRVAKDYLGGHPQDCTVEDNLALFLRFGWQGDRQFRYLQCQALAVLGGTLVDVCLGAPDARVRYLRLEYESDPLMLGELFSHPVVHVHSQPDEAPRFALESGGEGNTALLDFLDFLYRNFCHPAWSRWADAVWRKAAPVPEAATHFETIRSYFLEEDTPGKRGRLSGILDLCRRWLPDMKRAFRDAKREMPMNLSVDLNHRDLFTYHL